MYDLIIKNGMIADGSGADAFQADLAVLDGKIAKIGDCGTDAAKMEGYWADIVVIDREHLATNENPEEPGQAPEGIDYVIINGVITADHKKHTGVMAGKVLGRQ